MTMHRGAIVASRPRCSALSSSAIDADLARHRAHRRRMRGEVDLGQDLVHACPCSRLLKLAPPVAICSRLMQPKPRLSSTHDGELLAQHHRGRDLGIHHHVAAVAEHDDDLVVGLGHLDAEPAGDLVAHGSSRIPCGSCPARRPARACATRPAGRPRRRPASRSSRARVHRADHLRVRRQRVGRVGHRLGGLQPARPSPPSPSRARRRALPAARACRRAASSPTLASATSGSARCLPASKGWALSPTIVTPLGLEQRPGAGGEILQPRADGEHHIGLLGEQVRRPTSR